MDYLKNNAESVIWGDPCPSSAAVPSSGYTYPIPCGGGNSQDFPKIQYVWPTWEVGPSEPLFKVKLLNLKAKVPTKAYEGDLGWDVYSVAPYTIEKGHICMIQTGIAIQPRKGWGYIVKDRSSMSRSQVFTHGGVFDNGFRGEIVIGLTCEDPQYYISEGDKVAQIVFVPIAEGYPLIVEELDPSERGDKKWGSSGR
jgi:dUTP pyrophosphatase